MSYILNNEIKYSDSINIDAFNRLRTSEPYNLFGFSHTLNSGYTYFEDYKVGSGTTELLHNEAAVKFSVSGSGDIVRREQHGYNYYQPGKSQLVFLTGVFGNAVANTKKIMGYLNDDDGLYFGTSGTTFGVGLRTSTSGSMVESFVAQSDWNIDTLDTGSTRNPSGHHLDITKANIYAMNFQWLGVGRVTYALDIDGVLVPVHQVLNANNKTTVYMKTGNLPVRYEVSSTGGSDDTFKQICASVISEGGQEDVGFPDVASNGATTRTFNSKQSVISLRLATTFEGVSNRMKASPIAVELFAGTTNVTAYWELILHHSHHRDNNLGGTPTWQSINPNSPFEYCVNGTTVTGGTVLASGFVGAASDRTEGTVVPTKDFIALNMSGNTSDWLHLCVTPSANSAWAGKIHMIARY